LTGSSLSQLCSNNWLLGELQLLRRIIKGDTLSLARRTVKREQISSVHTTEPKSAVRSVQRPLKSREALIALLCLGTLAAGIITIAESNPASAKTQSAQQVQTGATEAAIESGHGTVLVDLWNYYGAGTTLYRTASTTGGANVYQKIGKGQLLHVEGIVVGKNLTTGQQMQAIYLLATGPHEGGPPALVWTKYGGTKTWDKTTARDDLRLDQAYAPKISFPNDEILATFDRTHIADVQSEKIINQNQELTGLSDIAPIS
jgi:hypothetical protein